MFKKSLLAAGLLGALSTASMAADVQIYGVVDYGFQYLKAEKSEAGVKTTQENLTLDSGVNAASRFGITGSEDLGNGLTVSFKLENGFKADDGNFGTDNKLFDREASLSVSSAWGTLSAGRMGAISAAAGTYDFLAIVDAFDGGDGEINGLVGTSRMDNLLVYQSPKMAGLQLTAEYSFKADNAKDAGDEGHESAQRYAGLALTGEYGNFRALLSYEQILESDTLEAGAENADGKIVTIGGNYDCGFATTFFAAQYFENLDKAVTTAEDGYALHLGTQVPVYAGTLTAGLYYNKIDQGVGQSDSEYTGGSVKYEYPLSVRTALYGSIGYAENDQPNAQKEKTTQAYFGITHTF